MLVIDSQIHFFGPRGSEVPGLAAHRKLSVPGILAEMDAAGVSAAVLVPARPDPSATNELALDAVAAAPQCSKRRAFRPAIGYGISNVDRADAEPHQGCQPKEEKVCRDPAR